MSTSNNNANEYPHDLDHYEKPFNQNFSGIQRGLIGESARNNNHSSFENNIFSRRGFNFSDNSWRSDDDEDYSLNEDLELNFKTVSI